MVRHAFGTQKLTNMLNCMLLGVIGDEAMVGKWVVSQKFRAFPSHKHDGGLGGVKDFLNLIKETSREYHTNGQKINGFWFGGEKAAALGFLGIGLISFKCSQSCISWCVVQVFLPHISSALLKA